MCIIQEIIWIIQNYYILSGLRGSVTDDEINATKGIDCSTFITWILIQYGYTEFINNYQLTTRDFYYWIVGEPENANYDLTKYGWEWASTKNETPQPGDILLKSSISRHVELFVGDGIGTYGAGGDRAIRRKISYPNVRTSRILELGQFDYIIRVKKPTMGVLE